MASRFDLKPRKRKAGASAKPRRNRIRGQENGTLPYWIAAVVVALIVVAVILVREWPAIHGEVTALRAESPTPNPSPAPEQAEQPSPTR
jgi:hypothetical protein